MFAIGRSLSRAREIPIRRYDDGKERPGRVNKKNQQVCAGKTSIPTFRETFSQLSGRATMPHSTLADFDDTGRHNGA